ncbi:hypothetical protein [Bacillus cereus]
MNKYFEFITAIEIEEKYHSIFFATCLILLIMSNQNCLGPY